MADSRENPRSGHTPVEIDRFEHVLASQDRALLRLDGRYSDAPGPTTLDAVLVVDDGESVRRHMALPDPNRLDPGFVDEEDWLWRTAFVVSTLCLRDQRTAFALEPEPGVFIDLPFPVERLVPDDLPERVFVGRVAPRQAVALGLAMTIALSSTAVPALADTQVLNVHGPDGKVTQVGRDGSTAPDTGGSTTPAPPQATAAGTDQQSQQPAPAAPDQQQAQQPQQQTAVPDATTPTPSTDSTGPAQEGSPDPHGGVRQEHSVSGHKQHGPKKQHDQSGPKKHPHRQPHAHPHHNASPRHAPTRYVTLPAPRRHTSTTPTSVPRLAPVPKLPNGGAFDQLPGPSTSSVPNFVIQRFHVPIFLLPIYQAAGIQYGIRWEVLAAINEIETDYGRNLNVSSAGALGWMQFMN